MADQPEEPKDDDMHDPKDRGAPFPLGEFLTLCDPCAETPDARPCLRKDFEDADTSAMRAQKKYRWAVGKAAILGLIALLIGLGQRIGLPEAPGVQKPRNPWLVLEFLYTVVALIFVLAAILTGKQAHWLSERFRAERMRLLKFKLLIDPRLWHASLRDLAPWKNRLETGRRMIANQSPEILDAFKLSDAMPDLPATDDCRAVEVPALQRLLEYYRRKRLGFQLEYFEGSARKKMALANPRLSPLFFFVGISLVLCNNILEWATKDAQNRRIELTILVLALLSFAVPMGWSRSARFGARTSSPETWPAPMRDMPPSRSCLAAWTPPRKGRRRAGIFP